MKITEFKTTTEARWFPIGQGAKVLVARAGNPKNREYIREHGKGLKHGVQAGFANEELLELTREATANTVLVGWEGIEDDKDKPIEYSPEAALKIFKEYPEFLELVLSIANDRANFRDSEADAGN